MRTIGVLGGMGPVATADFFGKLVRSCPATVDQEHPPCLIYSASTIPDRAAHTLGRGGADPTPALCAAAATLESAGAAFIAIPCNSAHAYLEAIQDAVSVPVLDMIAIAAANFRALESRHPGLRRVGLLAADGTVHARLYDEPLRAQGMEPVYPDAEQQARVMQAIRDIKGGRPGPALEALGPAAEQLAAAGSDCLLAGCTEIPVVVDDELAGLRLLDATQFLVDVCLAAAQGRVDAADFRGPLVDPDALPAG